MPGPRERSGGQAPEVPWPLGAFTTVPARRPLGGLLWWSRDQFFHWLDTLRARTARRPGWRSGDVLRGKKTAAGGPGRGSDRRSRRRSTSIQHRRSV